jgi:hypothetical protein
MGHMRTRSWWLAGLLMAGMVLAPTLVHGQPNYEVPPADPVFPFPLYHARPERGGFFLFGEFVMYRQTNPIHNQIVSQRGILDFDGSITGTIGAFVGSRQTALETDQLSGPRTYQPGFNVGLGWRFGDGTSVAFSWLHLLKAEYFAVATLVPPGLNAGPGLANTFLTSPVYNFPNDYAGPATDTGVGAPFATYGIWNAADEMSIEFTQRVQQFDLTFRKPIFDTETYRCYGLVGPRFFWIWERFKWRTVDEDVNGQALPSDVAIYTNIVSNRMYGAFIGVGNECYLGHGFALSLDLQAALFLDVVKERAKYEFGQKFLAPQNKRAITDYHVVPELQANLNLWWYPIEGVQIRLGYNVMAFFNTIAAKQPIDFNYGALIPDWDRSNRLFDGINFGIGLIF